MFCKGQAVKVLPLVQKSYSNLTLSRLFSVMTEFLQDIKEKKTSENKTSI